VHRNPSLCDLRINAQWLEATGKFDDETVIRQFLKYRINQQAFERHRITYNHEERAYLLGHHEATADYLEDALVQAEENRQEYARRTGTSVTMMIMDDEPAFASLLPGPARRGLEGIGSRTIIVPLNDAHNWDNSDSHASGTSLDAESDTDNSTDEL
jgi:hypothetical protein